ncbi:MAG: hypothetical protein ACOZF0_15515 [Thermodesulfobacteriota bacterium]
MKFSKDRHRWLQWRYEARKRYGLKILDYTVTSNHGGYNEIQVPRKKCVLIDYEEVRRLTGFTDFSNLQIAHRKWVNAAVSNSDLQRESMWMQSIAVGSRSFMALIKKKMNFLAIGRSIRQAENCSELREDEGFYNCFFGVKNSDIGPKNTYCWNINPEISSC